MCLQCVWYMIPWAVVMNHQHAATEKSNQTLGRGLHLVVREMDIAAIVHWRARLSPCISVLLIAAEKKLTFDSSPTGGTAGALFRSDGHLQHSIGVRSKGRLHHRSIFVPLSCICYNQSFFLYYTATHRHSL